MPDIITRNSVSVEQNWCSELANAISDPQLLLQQLEIKLEAFEAGFAARRLFAQRVPQSFIDRMEKGNPNDQLLRQILPVEAEFDAVLGFSVDPLKEQDNAIPGLLHKYKNRVLLIVKGGCAVNCRYCFRRHFPYENNKGNKSVWLQGINYIIENADIDEVILSGGDPLMAKDHELTWLVDSIAKISHVKTLRVHTRLPVVIPSRVTKELIELFSATRLDVVMVTHINHPNEINDELRLRLARLKNANVMLLNQSVLLAGVNDSVDVLKSLSQSLFSAGVLPYYLHLLDKVQGAAHFLVTDERAIALVVALTKEVSGYLVPRLMREEANKDSKTPIDLHLG